MRILVCCKVVPDLDRMAEEDWEIRDFDVETRFTRREWNCFDESALEMGLRLAESFIAPGDGISGEAEIPERKRSVTLTALNIGGKEADPFLKMLLALKYDRAVRIVPPGDIRFNPELTAELLADFLRNNEQDVILSGIQSSVGDNGQTPLLLAEILRLPCITQVFRFGVESSRRILVESRVDGGILEQIVDPPFVFTVGNAENSYLRVPTLKDRLKVKDAQVEVISPQGPGPEGIDPEGSRLTGLEKIDNRRAGVILDQGTFQDKALILYRDHLKKRLETL